jgi:hypothetical protein
MYISELMRVKKCVHVTVSLFYPRQLQPEFRR